MARLAKKSDAIFMELASRQPKIVVGRFKYLKVSGPDERKCVFGDQRSSKYDGIHFAAYGQSLFEKDVCRLLRSTAK